MPSWVPVTDRRTAANSGADWSRYPDTTCLGLPGRTKRPGVVEVVGQCRHGSPMSRDWGSYKSRRVLGVAIPVGPFWGMMLASAARSRGARHQDDPRRLPSAQPGPHQSFRFADAWSLDAATVKKTSRCLQVLDFDAEVFGEQIHHGQDKNACSSTVGFDW